MLPVAAQNQAGVHRSAEAQPHTHLLGDGREPLADLRRGSHRAQRVIFAHARDPEHSHQRVADELIDRPAVALDRRAQHHDVAIHHTAQRLRIHPLTHGSRARDTAEQGRHHLAGFPRRGRGGCLDHRQAARCVLRLRGDSRADDLPRAGSRCLGGSLWSAKRRIVAEDRPLELPQFGPGLQTDLIQRRARVAVGGERFRVTAATVQRKHQQPAGALAQRISRHKSGDRADHLSVLAASDPGLNKPLDRERTKLI